MIKMCMMMNKKNRQLNRTEVIPSQRADAASKPIVCF